MTHGAREVGPRRWRESFGRYFEEFEVGDVYEHRPGRTISETDNTWFTLLTNNTNQVHFNSEFAAATEFGRPLINSCLTLAIMHQDDDIVTIEGLGSPGALHPMQAAFVECDGFQCGYCTPGQICSAVGMLAEVKAGWPSHATADVASRRIALTDPEIRERMSGNICRCAAYPNIVAAIREVAEGGRK